MTTGHVFIAISLDGYIARPDGDIDWLMKQNTEGEDHGYDPFMASVDGLVMGRGSFEKIMTFDEWPYAKPVVVMSNSLTQSDIPDHLHEKVRLTRLSPVDLMKELHAKGWTRAYIDGGKVIQSFLNDGLIADMTITHVPILLGQGLPLFGRVPQDIDLTHVETKPFSSGLVSSTYKVNRSFT